MRSFEGAGFSSQAEAWKQGNRHMLQVVTDGLKLTPSQPSFVAARDAILAAALAQATNPAGWTSPDAANPTIAQVDEIQLWRGFARRGLGFDAVAAPRTDGVSGIEIEPINYYSIARFGCTGPGASFDAPDDDDVLEDLEADDSVEVDLPGTFTFYGKTYNSIFVNTNGSITFEDEDLSGDPTLDHHFEQPRISGFLSNLDASTTQGSISVTASPSVVSVLYLNLPEKGSIDPETGEGNSNSFQIDLYLDDQSTSEPQGAVITYGDIAIKNGVAGLSATGCPRGPRTIHSFQFRKILQPTLFVTVHFPHHSLQKLSMMQIPVDLNGHVFQWNYVTGAGWIVSPVESGALPFKALNASVKTTTGSTVINAGDLVILNLPLENKFKRANLSTVLGLLTPISDNVDVVDPVSDYGLITANTANAGADPFLIQISPTAQCGDQVRVKIDYASDQGIFGSKEVVVTIGEGYGEPQGSLSYPQGTASTGVVSAPVSATDLSVTLSSSTNMKAATNLKNTRTNEIVLATSWNSITKVLGIKRAQKGTLAAAINAGDTFQYDSIPIPDAVTAGVKLAVFPTDPAITGPVGKVKVTLGKFSHPHIQDLRMTLSNAQGYSMVLLEGVKPTLDNKTTFTNIIIDADASLSIQNNSGLADGTSYRPVGDFDVFADGGVNAGTTWTLTVADLFSPFAGDISSWSVELTPLISCQTQTLQVSNFAATGAEGWTTDHYGNIALMNSYFRPASEGSPAALVLNTAADDSVRVPGWNTPGVELNNSGNQIYRFHAYVARSGQPDLTKQEQIPFLRIRAAVGSVMTNMHDYLFNTTQLDPGANAYAMQMAPSTNPNTPTHYWVDFDPVDAPSLLFGSEPPGTWLRGELVALPNAAG